MALEFPNRSRSFDQTRSAVRFVGHDGMFEVQFYIESAMLTQTNRDRSGPDKLESDSLSAFDALRGSIHDVARKTYSQSRRNSYTLSADLK
jgi:hypothetical protein